MISLQSVTKQFKTKFAVHNISFQAKEGEIIGFIGPNGAGKTTTMRLILGYLSSTSGTITIDKKNPAKDRIHVLKQIGYLPENNPLYPEMKVKEYLQFIADTKEVKTREEISHLAEEIGFETVMNSKLEELSRGYKQRVGLAAALLGHPRVLILDEPTSGLDPIEKDTVKDFIKKIAKKKTIIFSTHVLSEVEDIATRLIMIKKGSIMYDGDKPKGKGAVESLFKELMGSKISKSLMKQKNKQRSRIVSS